MVIGAREAAKQKTRAALIEAGVALFREQGLDGPSLDAICERAGFTRGAFYVHFTDRDDFLVAVMQTVGGPILDALIGSDEPEELAAIAGRFVGAMAEGSYPLGPSGGIRPHQLLDACARSPQIRELYVSLVAEAIRRTGRVLERQQGEGSVRADVDCEATAALLLAAILGAQTMLELEVPFDFARMARVAMKLLSAG